MRNPVHQILATSQHQTAILDISRNHWHYCPRPWSRDTSHCILLDIVQLLAPFFPLFCGTYSLSPSFPNYLTSFQQMEPTPSQVRNYYSKKNQQAHLEGGLALAFNKTVNFNCPSNVWLPALSLYPLNSRWLMSLILLMKKDDGTHQEEIENEESEDTGDWTLSSNITVDNLDSQWHSNILARHHGTSQYKLQEIQCHRIGTVPILSLYTLHFQIPNIQLGQWHNHHSNAKSQPSSITYLSVAVHHLPRCSCCPSLLETRVFHKSRPVEIRTFPNTEALLLNWPKGMCRQWYSQRLLAQYYPMRSTPGLEMLVN